MNRLEIEWRHLDKDGKTCDRCSDTGKTVRRVCEELSRELQPKGWKVAFRETLLTDKDIPESNMILLNGIPLEEILPETRKSENCCDSCGELLGMPTLCRTIEHKGQTYEAIPASLIREAAYQLIHNQNR
jgi:hypothetical protein